MNATVLDLPAEPLCAELAQYVVTMPSGLVFLKHRLVNTMYAEAFNALYNRQFKHAHARLEEAEERHDWAAAIWITERPWRIDALLEYSESMKPEEVGALLPDVWIDSENIYEKRLEWMCLFEDYASYSKRLTASRKSLAPITTIFRGTSSEEARNRRYGLSWTTDEDRAKWFANRFSQKGRVLAATVNKKDVYGVLDDRNESEIIVRPSGVNLICDRR